VQEQHEDAVISDFVEWLNARRKTNFRVVAKPNPPEALIKSGRTTRWIEATDAFWSDEYAQDLYSYATPSETHKQVRPGRYMGMDALFASQFSRVLIAKLKKRSYLPFLKTYGPGFLIIQLNHPWLNRVTLREMKEQWRSKQPVEDLGCFKYAYITFFSPAGRVFQSWRFEPEAATELTNLDRSRCEGHFRGTRPHNRGGNRVRLVVPAGCL
jgi:hypothetical protein